VDAPLVSVVTPCLDQAAFVWEAIDSVRAQDYPNVEHIVVDAGSTDGTVDILRGYDHLRWISEPDRGQSHGLNKGVALARGDIIGWLNADDAYTPHAISEGVAALRETTAGLVYADVTRIDDDGVNPRRIRSRGEFDLWTELNLGCGIYSPAVFFTRAAWDGVGGADEALHMTMDYDLWLRIGERFGAAHVDAVWSIQRIHDDAKTMRHYDEFWPERLAVSRRHGGRLVSPLLIQRYVRSPGPRRLVTRAVGGVYALAGKRSR
jgi:glycosyltransferase involved in cell wall biosynthesis